jgi:hypothetical protein
MVINDFTDTRCAVDMRDDGAGVRQGLPGRHLHEGAEPNDPAQAERQKFSCSKIGVRLQLAKEVDMYPRNRASAVVRDYLGQGVFGYHAAP